MITLQWVGSANGEEEEKVKRFFLVLNLCLLCHLDFYMLFHFLHQFCGILTTALCDKNSFGFMHDDFLDHSWSQVF